MKSLYGNEEKRRRLEIKVKHRPNVKKYSEELKLLKEEVSKFQSDVAIYINETGEHPDVYLGIGRYTLNYNGSCRKKPVRKSKLILE